MQRVKKGKPDMPATAQTELRSIRLQISASDQKKFRLLAVQADTNMAILARKLVLDYIAAHEPKPKGGP
jgi:hypothetical protein